MCTIINKSINTFQNGFLFTCSWRWFIGQDSICFGCNSPSDPTCLYSGGGLVIGQPSKSPAISAGAPQSITTHLRKIDGSVIVAECVRRLFTGADGTCQDVAGAKTQNTQIITGNVNRRKKRNTDYNTQIEMAGGIEQKTLNINLCMYNQIVSKWIVIKLT